MRYGLKLIKLLSTYSLLTLITLNLIVLTTSLVKVSAWRGQWVEVLKDEVVGPNGSPTEVTSGDHAYLMLELMIKPPKEVEGNLYTTVTPTECFLPKVKSLRVKVEGPVVSDWVGIAGTFGFGDVVKVYLPIKVVKGAGTYSAKLIYRVEYLTCANIIIDKVIYNRTYELPIKVVITGKPKLITDFELLGNLSKDSWTLAKVVIKNLGDAVAHDVVTELSSEGALVNQSVIHLSNLGPGSTYVKYVMIRAVSDSVSTSLRTTYLGPKGLKYSYLTTYAYVLKKLKTYLVTSLSTELPKVVEVNSLVKAELSIKCLGNGEGVSNVVVKVSTPKAEVIPQVLQLGWLGRGESRVVGIYVRPQSEGEVPVNIVITYVGSDGREYSIIKSFKFMTYSPPSITASPTQPYITKDSRYLGIKVSNLGGLPAEDTELIIDSVIGAVTKVRVFRLGELLPNKSVSIEVPVTNVTNDVNLCFTIKYLDVGSSKFKEISKCVKYPFMRFLKVARVSIEAPTELSLKPGTCLSRDLIIRVKGLAEVIKLAVITSSSIEASIEPTELINKSAGTYVGKLIICVPKSAVPSNYLVSINCKYLSRSEWREYSVSTLVKVEEIKSPVITAELLNTSLGVGDGVVLIKVSSTKSLKELVVKVSSSVGSVSKVYYGVKDVLVPVKVTVLPDLVGRSISFNVWVKYLDIDGIEGTSSFDLPTVVTGEPNLQLVYVTVAPKVAYVNSTVAVSALIANRGVAPAYATVAKVIIPKGFEVIGESSIYLGEVSVGATSVISFSMRVINASGGTYYVPINVTYYDPLHRLSYRVFKVKVVVAGSNVTASVGTSELGTSLSPLPPPPKVPNYLVIAAIVAAVVIGVIVAVLAIRGSRK